MYSGHDDLEVAVSSCLFADLITAKKLLISKQGFHLKNKITWNWMVDSDTNTPGMAMSRETRQGHQLK